MLAIENENMELMECLLKNGASPGDALLHAISEEYVEAVERLLIHEESIHVPNTSYVSNHPPFAPSPCNPTSRGEFGQDRDSCASLIAIA